MNADVIWDARCTFGEGVVWNESGQTDDLCVRLEADALRAAPNSGALFVARGAGRGEPPHMFGG